MNKQGIEELCADNIRILIATMVENAKSGHPGGAMGGADFIQILFSEYLNFNPYEPEWPFRDRFFLDPGHMSPLLYSILTLCGYLDVDDLKEFRQFRSKTPGHPERNISLGIENTSGPLGLGHAFGLGAAITERFFAERFGEWLSHKTYIYISDGGIQEEISQGVGRIAGHLGLSNLIMFYDANEIQLSTKVKKVTSENTARKYKSWGWRVIEIDGHNKSEIRDALDKAVSAEGKPTLIIGNTIMGKGIVKENDEPFEKKVSTHGQPISKSGASYEKTIRALGGDIDGPFFIFPEVEEYYSKIITHKIKYFKELKSIEKKWRKANNELAAQLDKYLNNHTGNIPFEEMDIPSGLATRDSSGLVLARLSDYVENIIVASADLSESDKTNYFLEKTTAFKRGNFKGNFLQAGVSELTMGAIACGMAIHGGVVPVCATFFVFSDYMKPVVRLAALMELPVIFVWTHDSFRVGEDGPTHQPVEHEAQIRLMEQLKNHSGEASLIALRPCGTEEAIASWKFALENNKRPTAMILSRQKLEELPKGERASRIENIEKGAYIIWESDNTKKPDVILLANGSEVSTLYSAAINILKERNINIRIVSIISVGLFLGQEQYYVDMVLPQDTPVFALTSGLKSVFGELNIKQSFIYDLGQFGDSAPAGVLDDKYKFSEKHITQMLSLFIDGGLVL